jgi:hypothetical protein
VRGHPARDVQRSRVLASREMRASCAQPLQLLRAAPTALSAHASWLLRARALLRCMRAGAAHASRYTLRLGNNISQEPGIIMGADGASGARVKLLRTNADVIVNDTSMLSKLSESFSPGDTIKRAMLSGAEEDATVRQRMRVLQHCARAPSRRGIDTMHLAPRSCPPQVVCVNSPGAVTIRILPNGPTYSSDVKRLRKVSADDGAVTKTDPTTTATTNVLDIAALERSLAAKFPQLATSARHNPHAAPGTPLHSRFAAAAAAPNKTIDIMLHGTAETNVDSILQTSLRGRPGCGTCWFTDDLNTAAEYAKSRGGAKRMIAFAVLRDKGHAGSIYTTNDAAHHLPLFEMDHAV